MTLATPSPSSFARAISASITGIFRNVTSRPRPATGGTVRAPPPSISSSSLFSSMALTYRRVRPKGNPALRRHHLLPEHLPVHLPAAEQRHHVRPAQGCRRLIPCRPHDPHRVRPRIEVRQHV